MKKLIDRLGLPRVIGIAGLALLIIVFLISLLFQNRKIEIGNCDITFVGTENDADCCIMISDGSCLVIDTGEEADGPHIAGILREKGIETINCLILSHPDNDHIGGASLLADSFDIEMVIMPYFGKYRISYTSLLNRFTDAGAEQIFPAKESSLSVGDLSLTVYPPENNYYDQDNDYSLAVLVRHGEVNMFFPGDAEKIRLKEIASISLPDIDLLKVPHHGRSSSAASDFIQRISAPVAIVNAASAESKVQNALEKTGAAVYYTVGSDQHFTSDGETLTYTGT